MLQKKHRLTRREDFSAVYSKGSYAAEGGVAIKYLKISTGLTHIGFSIGKNFSKKATARNRVRRLLQEACHQHIATLKPGFDIVVMIHPQNAAPELRQLTSILGKIFTKANLFI